VSPSELLSLRWFPLEILSGEGMVDRLATLNPLDQSGTKGGVKPIAFLLAIFKHRFASAFDGHRQAVRSAQHTVTAGRGWSPPGSATRRTLFD
jgi:hypothetical protein